MHRPPNPVTGHMLCIFPTVAVSGILLTLPGPNMIHCFRQQPLVRTVRTPHLHKPGLTGSSLLQLLICSPVHTFKPTRGPRCLAAARLSLFGRCHAIASGSCRLVLLYAVQLPPLRRVLPLQGTCCWYAEAKPFPVWPNQCF